MGYVKDFEQGIKEPPRHKEDRFLEKNSKNIQNRKNLHVTKRNIK